MVGKGSRGFLNINMLVSVTQNTRVEGYSRMGLHSVGIYRLNMFFLSISSCCTFISRKGHVARLNLRVESPLIGLDPDEWPILVTMLYPGSVSNSTELPSYFKSNL